jgi:hypothetical protein
MIAASIQRAIELGIPREDLVGMIGQVLQLDEAMRDALATQADGSSPALVQLDAWYAAMRGAATNAEFESPQQVFAFVLDFAAGTALGAGVTLPDALAIVQQCAEQIMEARAAASHAAPPATAPPATAAPPQKRWAVPE